MHYFDFEGKRRRAWLRLALYLTSGIIIGIATVLLVLAAQGYDFDPRTGQVIKNGLILVDSAPEQAVISLNGQTEEDRSPSRLPVPAGEYDVKLELPGYRPWQRHVAVEASMVTWLYYPRLVPTELTTTTLDTLREVSFFEASPNRRRALLYRSEPQASLWLYDLGKPDSDPERLAIDDDLLAGSAGNAGSVAFAGWADNSRHALLKQTYRNRDYWIWVDVSNPEQSVNLTESLDTEIDSLVFRPGSADELYSLRRGQMRRLDADDETISGTLVSGIEALAPDGDDGVYYVQRDGGQASLGYFDGRDNRELRELTNARRYRLAVESFDNDRYLAVGASDWQGADIFRNAHRDGATEAFATVPLANASRMRWSENGRFLMLQSGGQFAVRDLDDEQTFTYTLPNSESARGAVWVNGHRLAVVIGSKLNFFDFDGSNRYELLTAEAGFTPTLDSGYRYLYTLRKSGNSLRLQSTELLVGRR